MNQMDRLENETLEDYLWRLGNLKTNKEIENTWHEIAEKINEAFDLHFCESSYRRKYKRLVKAFEPVEDDADDSFSEETRRSIREMDKQRIRVRDERTAFTRQMMLDARFDAMLETIKDEIHRVKPIDVRPVRLRLAKEGKAVFAMLSDIHYGLCFEGFCGTYDPEIAKRRVMNYAGKIIEIGEREGIDHCYVSLMGDLISGGIHNTIKSENRDHVVAQVIGVSELISEFLYELCQHFTCVHVNCVSGNHSRLDQNAKNVLRSERLDALIPWYCEAKLDSVCNIVFYKNQYDSTLAEFCIVNKSYVSVHGDMDDDLKQSAVRLSEMIGHRIDYLLAGHTHVAACKFDRVGFIKNGAVVTGGDDYTVKKRLFGPAYQVCMVCTEDGVEAVYPIRLV